MTAAQALRLVSAGWVRVWPGRGLKDHWTRNGRLLSTASALEETDMDLFDQTPEPAPDPNLDRLRAAGFMPYSGSGAISGYWQRKGDPKTYTTEQALALLADSPERSDAQS